MFLLGHACWSYLLSKYSGKRQNVTLPAYLALLSGVLPDFDIYLQPYIQHHTITHSLFLLLPASIILSYKYKELGLAFSLGLLSHLLTDSLVGTVPVFYPLTSLTVGVSLGIPSLADTFLETGALAVSVAYALYNGDKELLVNPKRDSLRLAIPLVSIITLSLLFAGDNNIPLTSLAFSRKALTLITIAHVILTSILLVGVVQGLRWYFAKGHALVRKTTVTPSTNPPTTLPDGPKRRGLVIPSFTWWDLPKRAWYLILTQLVVILLLAGSLATQYFTNIYFQYYVNSLAPVLVPLLSVAFGITSATVAVRLYFHMQRIQSAQYEAEAPARRKSATHKPSRRATQTPIPPAQNHQLSSATTGPAKQSQSISRPAVSKPADAQAKTAKPLGGTAQKEPGPGEKPS